MSRCDMMPFWTDAYLGDTSDLSTEEHGAYILLLVHAWRANTCSIPNDDKKLARIVRLTPLKWKKIKYDVLSFWVLDETAEAWVQKRLKKEWDKQRQYSKTQSEKAKKRWDTGDNNSSRGQSKSLKSNETEDPVAYAEKIPAEAEAENYYIIPKGRMLTSEQISMLIKSGGTSIDQQHACIQDMTIPSQWIEGNRASDFDLDVIPTIIRLSKKPRKPRGIKSWDYFTAAIQETRDRRELNVNNRNGLQDEHRKINKRPRQASIAERRRSAALKVASQYPAD